MLTALLTGEGPLKTYAKTTNPGFDQLGRRCLLSLYFLPLFVPFVIRLYDILMRMAWQVTRQSDGGENRPQSHADGTVEGVPVPPRQPT